ncbi:prostaglandin E synthase 2 [Teleopsis dalmanni]|uniref:prostaglandin E synthase 2 n=1 Tax=Teleopsis dalmanni TaxID=139649 RepID=UPI0018CED0DC|nr:prostaglandin E synthase 2 [Teleopsis dalmanni]
MSTYRLATTNISRQVATLSRHQRVLPPRNGLTICRQLATKVGPPKGTSTFKLALIGATLGGASGTAYTLYNNWRDKNAHMEHERTPPQVIDALPDNIRITKRYVNPKDKSGLEIILFQFQTCPFCCKVRSFLDYMGISYAVVEVDAVLRQDIKWSKQKKVPTVLIRQQDGKYVQMCDSSAIISLISTYLNDKHTDIGELAQFYPTISYFDDNGKKIRDILNKYFLMYQEKTPKNFTKEMEESERKWRTWADNHLVHLISPNCYQTLGEAFETFDWFSEAGEWDVHFPKWERNLMVYVGASAMWGISKMLKRRHGLSDDVRSHIYDALDKWTREIKKRKTQFMGGKEPNLADLSVFGVLSSMEGCQAFKDCLENTNIGEWFYGVKQKIDKNKGNLIRERIEGEVLKAEFISNK